MIETVCPHHIMASVAGAQPPGGPPHGAGPPPLQGPSGSLPDQRTCICHPNRELTYEDISQGHTRCVECRNKHRESTAAVSYF
jgi:hypothetical protein